MRSTKLLLLCILVGRVSIAQQGGTSDRQDEWRLDLNVGGQRLSLALPPFDSPRGTPRETANEFSRILRDDISFASVFRIVDPERYPRARRGDAFDHLAWESVGADVVISGTLSREAGALVANVRTHDVLRKVAVFDTVYRSSGAPLREFAHHISDQILARFGVPGVASTKIVFASTRADGRKAIYEMDYDGEDVRQLTRNRHLDFQPRLSPDDQTLSFISYAVRNDSPVLAVLNGEPLYSGPGMIFSADWSPDGEYIAFAASRDEPGNAEIYVARHDGTQVRRITHHPRIDVSPTWSPTGREIAFTSDRAGSPQIYVMDAEGLNLRRVSMKGSYNAEPAWSPSRDRSELAYATRVGGGDFDIVVHDLETRTIRVLTSGTSMNESPRWAPNGRHLVFASNRTGTTQLYTVNRDGSNPSQLTFDGENVTPSWGPQPKR